MPLEQFYALVLLAFPSCFSPGLNNALTANSAATFGFRRTLPHIAGIVTGFPSMLFVAGVFLAGIFRQSEMLRQSVQIAGSLMLLWLAFKIARKGSITSAKGNPRPFRFLEAFLFQWVNPKAWTLAVAGTSQFVTAERPIASAAIVAVVFGAAVLGSNTTWALAGQTLVRLNSSPAVLRGINLALAAMIVLTVLLMFAK
jgi:threonine/homoserine/homoserine lactone efflux protein